MPPHRHRDGEGPTDLTDSDISFPLARLFDRFNMDHIPERKRMEEFEHRDLAHVKHYKAAVKIFGGPLSRKRVIIAPPMETPTKHRLGLYFEKRTLPSAPQLNTELKPQKPFEKPEPEEITAAREARVREDTYKSWFKERQQFRNDLENMGLNTEWLSKKKDKTVLETRVLKQLKDAERQNCISEETESDSQEATKNTETSYDSDSSSLPQLKIPAPLGIKILNQHLKQKKMRLIDLFTAADKNKDWKMSRDEFIKICEEKNIPISQGLLEDMLISLDMNLDAFLDYKELATGLEQARRELREDKRKELSREATKNTLKTEDGAEVLSETPDSSGRVSTEDRGSGKSSKKAVTLDTTTSLQTEDKVEHSQSPKSRSVASTGSKTTQKTTGKKKLDDSSSTGSKTAQKSEKTGRPDMPKNMSFTSVETKVTYKSREDKSSSQDVNSNFAHDRSRSEQTGSPMYLEPPPIDMKPDRLVLATDEEMVDLRKRDREGLKGYNAKLEGIPPTILTGNKAVDDHSMQSTIGGEIGEMIDKFRQRRLQEYFAVTRLCKEKDVALSEKLLERVLLYPPDRPHTGLHKLRPPDSAPLHSKHMAVPPKRPRTPIEVKHKDKLRRSSSGHLLIDSRHQYPSSKRVADVGCKENLSTGRAVIRRKTDCWMTFEEYESLTKHLAVRYQHLHGTSSGNAFWPGHLLDKLRLCMPPYDKPYQGRDKESAIFTRTGRKPAVNYGYEPTDVWQTNNDMYTQIGIHDPYKNKMIY